MLKKEEKETLSLYKDEDVIKNKNSVLVISPEFRMQRKYLSKNHSVEWCGILLYKILSGSVLDLDNLVLEVGFIYLTGLGTHSFTEGEYNDALLKMMDIPEFEGYSYAMIHSHGDLDTFFSGTDIKQMDDNYQMFSPFYLSLVVNNKGSYSARIVWEEIIERKATTITKKVIIDNKYKTVKIDKPEHSKRILKTLELHVIDKVPLGLVKDGDNVYLHQGKLLINNSDLLYDKSINLFKWFEDRFKEIKTKHTKKLNTFSNTRANRFSYPTYNQETLWNPQYEIVSNYQLETATINKYINYIATKGQNKVDNISIERFKQFDKAKILNVNISGSDLVQGCKVIFPHVKNVSTFIPELLDVVYELLIELDHELPISFALKIEQLNIKLSKKWKVE